MSCLKMDLVRHPVFWNSLAQLREEGVRVLHEPEYSPFLLWFPVGDSGFSLLCLNVNSPGGACILAIKLYAYRHAIQARQWRKDHPVLPILLFLVPTVAQERRIARIASKVMGETTITIRTTTVSRLVTQGPLAAIWQPSGNRLVSRLGEKQAQKRLFHARGGWILALPDQTHDALFT